MLNLKEVLAEDIRMGIVEAQKAGALPELAALPAIAVERPDGSEHGDYASPIALALAKAMQKSPMDIVHAIAEHMPKKEYVGKLEGAAPGFLNIRLHTGWMTSRLNNVIEDDLCSGVQVGQGRSVNLEFISANPTGPLTLGNIRTAFSVDTLGTVLECAGYAVTREYYFNDAGAQVRKLGESVVRRWLQKQGEDVEYPDELYQGDYILDVAEHVAENLREHEGRVLQRDDLTDAAFIDRIGKDAAALLMTAIKQMVRDVLKIDFDVWVSEEDLRAQGAIDAVVQRLKERDVVYEKDGAVFLRTTAYGDSEDRVLVKRDGEYAYIAPDIAYHQHKYDRGFDEIFTFVGADHQGHLPKVRAAMLALGNDVDRLHLETSQWFRVVRGGKPVKLSKRAGAIVTPQTLIDEVGYDAARFFMVQHHLSTHMDFDLDLARERSERNPVYYVQYAYVRLQSLLRRAKEESVIDRIGVVFDLSDSPALTHTLELSLMRTLYRFPEVVAGIAERFTVHELAYYAVDLARCVHVFYRHVPVLSVEEEVVVKSRLQLVLATQVVLGKVLDLLGVSKPDVM